MANLTHPLLPSTDSLLHDMGERLRLARLRRRLQAKQVAERACMSVITLRKIERGDAGVTMGAYCSVLQVLQLQSDLKQIAAEDPLGRRLQDIEGEGRMRVRRGVRNSTNRLKHESDANIDLQKVPDYVNSGSESSEKPDIEISASRAISSEDLIGLLDLDFPLPSRIKK